MCLFKTFTLDLQYFSLKKSLPFFPQWYTFVGCSHVGIVLTSNYLPGRTC